MRACHDEETQQRVLLAKQLRGLNGRCGMSMAPVLRYNASRSQGEVSRRRDARCAVLQRLPGSTACTSRLDALSVRKAEAKVFKDDVERRDDTSNITDFEIKIAVKKKAKLEDSS